MQEKPDSAHNGTSPHPNTSLGKPEVGATAMVAACMEEYQRQGESALERICREHPALAQRLKSAALGLKELLAAAGAAREGESPPDAFPGWSLGPFQVVGEVGSGGMGIVYQAFDPRLQRTIALKTLPPSMAGSPEALERFQREARALAKVRHPHIVTIHEVGKAEDGTPFISMAFIAGHSLQKILDRLSSKRFEDLEARDLLSPREEEGSAPGFPRSLGGRSYLEALARMAAKVADALDHAHREGVIHRDVKPANILLDKTGEPYLSDFGIAKLIGEEGLTLEGVLPGTPAYMAPEQVSGKSEIGPWTDVYGLGAALYHCLCLRPPFGGETREQVFDQIRHREPLPPRKIHPGLPKDLETICLTAMEKDPSRRYRSAGEMKEDLERFLAFLPVKARPLGALARLARSIRRNPLKSAVWALSGILVLGGPLSFGIHENWAKTRIAGVLRKVELAKAKTHMELARRAAQRGNWEKALENYRLAEKGGYPDKVEIDIGRIEAWEGNLQTPQALSKIEELKKGNAFDGPHGPQLLLLEADLDVNRWKDPEAKLDLAKEALDSGELGPSEEFFAKALFAQTVDEALGFTRKALEADPYNRRANDFMGGLLLISGRLAEADTFSRVMRSIYPNDPSTMVYQALVLALENKKKDYMELLSLPEVRKNQSLKGWIEFMKDCADLIHLFDEYQVEVLRAKDTHLKGKLFGSFLPVTIKTVNRFKSTRAALEEKKGGKRTTFYFRIPPVFARNYKNVVADLLGTMLGTTSKKKLMGTLDRAGNSLGDSWFHFAKGLLLADEKKFLLSAEEFRKASEKRSLFFSRRTCELFRVTALSAAAAETLPVTRKEMALFKKVSKEAISDLLEERSLGKTDYRLLFMLNIVPHFPKLALETALRWERAFPGDPEAKNAVDEATKWFH